MVRDNTSGNVRWRNRSKVTEEVHQKQPLHGGCREGPNRGPHSEGKNGIRLHKAFLSERKHSAFFTK